MDAAGPNRTNIAVDRVGAAASHSRDGQIERVIAERLLHRAKGQPPRSEIDLTKALPWVEGKTGKTISPSQREAVRLTFGAKLAVITGGHGVGKTSTLDTILRILCAKGTRVLLTAPTGRAAKRMSEQTSLEAKTIHNLLEIDPKHGGSTACTTHSRRSDDNGDDIDPPLESRQGIRSDHA